MAYADVILAESDLVAYWQFDESSGTTAVDAFGSTDLTIAGGVTLGATSLVADGVSAYTFSSASNGRASIGSSFPEYDISVEGWFQASGLVTQRQGIWFNG